MKRSSVLPLGIAWLFGFCGAIFRNMEWMEGVDGWTRLFSPNGNTWVLCALSVLSVLFFIRISRRPYSSDLHAYSGSGGWHRFRMRPKLPRQGGIHGRTGIGYRDVNVAAAVLLIAAGVVGLWQQFRSYTKRGVVIAAFVLCFFAAAAVIAASKQVALDQRSDRFPMLLMLPSLCTLLWLVARYQQFAREPVLLFYVWQLLALAATVLAVYFMVSLSLGRGSAARVGATSLIAVYLTLVSLGDVSWRGIQHQIVPLLMDAFVLLYLSAQAWLVLREEPDPDQYPLPPKEENSDE